MKIDASASALLYNYLGLTPTATDDTFALAGGTSTGATGTSTSQISPLDSPGSLALQAEIGAQLAASPGGDASGGNVHDMTNAQLEAYATANNLSDVAGSFQVDYASADRSAAGEATFYQNLMSDPTQHDFVQQFEAAAQWQLQHGSTSGYDHFENMAKELTNAANGKITSV